MKLFEQVTLGKQILKNGAVASMRGFINKVLNNF